MAANRDHINSLLGDSGSTSDTPADAGAMQRELEREAPPNPDQRAPDAQRDWGLDQRNGAEPDAQQQQPAPTQQPPAPQPEETGMVPSARLRDEAEARRAAEERERRIADRFELLQSQIRDRQEADLARTKQSDVPNPEEDLLGFVQHQSRRLEDALEEINKRDRDRSQQTEQEQLINQVKAQANLDAQTFAQQNPDFQQAYQWLRNSQIAELEALGANRQEAVAELDQQELRFSAHRLQRGMNAAEGFYAQAKARGWGGQQQQPQQQQNGGQQYQVIPPQQGYQQQPQQQGLQPNYQPPAVHTQPLANMQRGMEQNQSLGQVPQASPAVPMDLERFANMSDADFMQYANQAAALMAREMR